jgi:capsular polysaccharide export protein
LEDLIARAARLSEPRLRLAAALRDAICKAGLTKYNLGGLSDLPDPPKGRAVVLVPGQVEDDASILLGASDVATNFDLVRNARRLYPDAWIIYKPHPDVEAGLRQGAVPNDALLDLVDHVAYGADTAALLGRADRVVTMTSGLGFEALLRGISVTTLGAPFYAGWGLTRDLGDVPERRTARPSIDALVHATLITYPRYFDPVSGLACPPEVAVARLISGDTGPKRHGLAVLSWAQDVLKRQSWLWRRG